MADPGRPGAAGGVHIAGRTVCTARKQQLTRRVTSRLAWVGVPTADVARYSTRPGDAPFYYAPLPTLHRLLLPLPVPLPRTLTLLSFFPLSRSARSTVFPPHAHFFLPSHLSAAPSYSFLTFVIAFIAPIIFLHYRPTVFYSFSSTSIFLAFGHHLLLRSLVFSSSRPLLHPPHSFFHAFSPRSRGRSIEDITLSQVCLLAHLSCSFPGWSSLF